MRTQTVNFQIEYTVMREIGKYESLATMTEKRNCGLHLSTVILHGSFKEELTASRCCIFIFCVVRHRKYFTRICCNTVICSNRKFGQPWFMYGVYITRKQNSRKFIIWASRLYTKCCVVSHGGNWSNCGANESCNIMNPLTRLHELKRIW